MKIDIVMITDNNYVMPTLVAITSMIVNKMDTTNYNINILTNELTQENILLLKKCESEQIKINIIDKSEIISRFKDTKQNRHVTTTAILKFYIPEIFSEVDKILYLDGDILVQNDLSILYAMDMKNYYALVVKDTLSKIFPKHMKTYKIHNKFYFNSGVMLLNLKQMRNDGITNKLIDYKVKIETPFMDQDALNAIIGNNVSYISYKYNFLNYYTEVLSFDELSKFFEEKFLSTEEDIYKECTILHLGGKEKPWKYEMGYLSNLYKLYYEKTPLSSEQLVLQALLNKKVHKKKTFLEKIFSKEKDLDGKHEVITLMGIKLKYKRKFI
ncbi:MAG: glycosyltransferase family 8 protein [Candidatus Gastranaerophilales bacterium]|nr:glycosyltransferase family 8 protein [Candidatus Gastranaerophilales bacterium]